MDDSVTYATKTKLDYPAIFDEKKKTHRLKGFAGERHYIALRHALIRIKVRGTDSK